MLIEFFYELRRGGLKPSITEFLMLLEALRERVAFASLDEFYYLARACLIKDETKFDRFDRVFAEYFKGIENAAGDLFSEIPGDWLEKMKELQLDEQQKRQVESMGGWEQLMETLKKRLEEQTERHEGGSKWIGTAGTSPFGAYGYNPEGIRIGQDGNRNKSAVKVWDRREFSNLDDSRELGTRNIKLALRKLRRFAREGAAEELDLDHTIDATARNAGLLDLHMRPQRHNAVKVLLFFDVGGSMDPHVRMCEELFSAARAEFKHLEYFYFHNFLYEGLWKDNRRRRSEQTPTYDVLHTYPSDYKAIFVGDASMSPYEIAYPGGSVEHWNEESGAVWMQRLLDVYTRVIWLNPEPEKHWAYTPSIRMTRDLLGDHMYPMTLDGLERGIGYLTR